MIELNKIYNDDCFNLFPQIDEKSVDVVLTDIPYGMYQKKHDGGRKPEDRIRKTTKGIADVVDFDLSELTRIIASKTKQSAYIFCGINQVSEIQKAMIESEMTTRLCIFQKINPSPMVGQYMWLSDIECCVFGRFPKATFNEFCQSSIWRCKCGSSKIHPTQKPIELFKRLILASTNPGDIVFDPFSGSGTTAVACKKTGRQFIAIEKNTEFYNVSVKRFNEETMQQELF